MVLMITYIRREIHVKRDLDKSIANIDKRLHELDKMIDSSNAKSKEEIKNDYANKSKEKKLAETELETVTKYHINSLIINGPLIMCKTSLDSATSVNHYRDEQGQSSKRLQAYAGWRFAGKE